MKHALTFGLILLALTVGWFVFRSLDDQKPYIAGPPESQNQNSEVNVLQPSPKQERGPDFAVATPEEASKDPNRLLPKPDERANDQPRKRDLKKPRNLDSTEPPRKDLVAQDEVPKNETDENGVLRLPIRERNFRDIGESRNLQSRKNGLALDEIRYIYFEIAGDEILGKQIAEQLADEIGKSGRFTITTDKELAQAALKLYVRHESDVDEPDEKTVAVIVRLVNEKGFVVYPNRKGVSGWKYVGTIKKLPLRVATDLVNAKK